MPNDKFTLILDSTQIQAFSECPQMWQLAYREHLVPVGAGEKEAMNAGTYGHSMLDVYYKSRATGRSLDDSIDIANRYNPDIIVSDDGIIDNQIFPLSQDLRYLVKARFRDHVFKYRNNDIIPHSPESVEVGFSEPIYEDSENLFVLEGRFDILGSLQGVNLVMDHKFQMRQRNLYKKSIQFRNYNLVSGYQTLMVNYIRLTKKVDDSTFVREAISFQPAETRWWKGELIKYYFRIKDELISHSHPTYDSTTSSPSIIPIEPLRQEWGACAGKFGYPCAYTFLCEHTDQQLVQSIKASQYQTREAWSPWT